MIGIFDSGVGGMTVAKAVEELLPNHPLVYLGDLARSPYGSKSPEAIEAYSVENGKFLIENGAKLIVIACNSASSVAVKRLQNQFDVPVFEVITPAVNQAVEKTASGRIGIIGTRATVNSGIYTTLIQRRNASYKVFAKACPLLVPLVEEGWLKKRETKMILRRYLASLKQQRVDTLVLGCTHYPLLSELIQHRIGRRVHLVSSSQTTAQHLYQSLASSAVVEPVRGHNPKDNNYFVTDLSPAAQKVADIIFNRPVQLQKV